MFMSFASRAAAVLLVACPITALASTTTTTTTTKATKPTSTTTAPTPTSSTVSNPCANFTSNIQNSINTQIASVLDAQPTITLKATSRQSQSSFTTPKLSIPYVGTFGGKTYSADASSSTAVIVDNLTASIALGQTSCTQNPFVDNGTVQVNISAGSLQANAYWNLDGYLIQYSSGQKSLVTVEGLNITLSGTYSAGQSTTNNQEAQLNSLQFNTCTVSYSSVSGITTNVANKVSSSLSNAGPQICSSLNSKLSGMLPKTI